ncbi:hypothetical protein V6N12_046559 [Hibiscus sabdariffa]|uniref:Uncharacterized protein n=1 Tax=Hibiscus sabdariffa TaxID=183260 RepID=A0ABR2DJ09_9ROSI
MGELDDGSRFRGINGSGEGEGAWFMEWLKLVKMGVVCCCGGLDGDEGVRWWWGMAKMRNQFNGTVFWR